VVPDPAPDRVVPLTRRLDLGSLAAHVTAARDLYLDALAELFCAAPRPVAADEAPPDAEITVREREGWPPDDVRVPADGLVIAEAPSGAEIHTEALSLQLRRRPTPIAIAITVRTPGMPGWALKVHLGVALFKALALLDRLMLHAAAVQVGGSVSAFVGPKGAGKSTACLALARAGATVLAEDRVLLARAGDRFVVSGCGERSRITAKTERHFFAEPLPVPARDVDGVLKKEFPAGAMFSWRPYRDHPLDRLFFLRVGPRFAAAPLSRRQALVELLRETRGWHRFSGEEDHRRHLAFLGACVEALPAFRLELSEDLAELPALVTLLGDAERLRT
jgi:hypothetical protein